MYIKMPRARGDNTLGIYIHVPFCHSKCGYCDFYSVTDSSCARRYTEALLKQIGAYASQAKGCPVESVYIGGGTPSVLPARLLKRILAELARQFELAREAEVTVEVNPESATPRVLRALRKSGVNRLSIGLQSADDRELELIGRPHRRADFEAAFSAARKAGFDNISVDLMYGLPGQSEELFLASLRKVVSLGPAHVSCYALTLEEGAPMQRLVDAGALTLPDDEAQRSMYMLAIDTLETAGLKQYEISNFARQGRECRHNLRYWDCGQYLGFGPAAASYFGGKRFRWPSDVAAFCAAYLDDGDWEAEEVFDIPPGEMAAEYVMLRLRLTGGIDSHVFERRFSRDFDAMFGKKLRKYMALGLVANSGDRYALTPEGFFVSNSILADLIDF